MSKTKAIIIGGGIGGLTAAIALRAAGLDVEVYERVDKLAEVGAGLSLWSNAVKVLYKLGLAHLVQELGVVNMEAGIRSWQGKLLMGGSLAELEERFGAPNILVHRAELQASLLEALGGQYVTFGKQCVRVEQDGTGVTAHFADGSQARGELLVGADGLHSVIRAHLHGPKPPTYAGYTAWRGIVEFDHQQLQPGESWGAGMRFGQLPLSYGRVYWFATKNAPEGEKSLKGEKEELLELFSNWHAPIKALIEATKPTAILRHDIYDRPVLKKWGKERMTLLGDAAHPMTPNLGQGACQALEDTLILANALQEVPDIPSALRAYEAQRIPRTNALVKQSRQIGQMGQWQHPLAVRMRDFLAQQLLSRFQMRQLEPILGYETGVSPLGDVKE